MIKFNFNNDIKEFDINKFNGSLRMYCTGLGANHKELVDTLSEQCSDLESLFARLIVKDYIGEELHIFF